MPVVKGVLPGSIADEGGVVPGDTLLAINGEPINDVFDLHFHQAAPQLELLLRGQDGEEWILDVEKADDGDSDEDDDLGLIFDDGLLDKPGTCRNKCVFCFIDQLPRNMRHTLYFKDDDIRLSFLNGNYVTLTNTTQEVLKRVVRYRLSPVCVSVHSTDAVLRAKMLGIKSLDRADILPKLRYLTDEGITVHAQIVLCIGYNDGARLDETLHCLGDLNERIESVSVVPSGLTEYRDNLPELRPFSADDAKRVLRQLEFWQKNFMKSRKSRFVYPADEFFVLAGETVPSPKYYEGYPQLENGVGMISKFKNEFRAGLRAKIRLLRRHVQESGSKDIIWRLRPSYIFTGEAAAKMMSECAAELIKAVREEGRPDAAASPLLPESACCEFLHVVPVRNEFFGGAITATGLLTGKDILKRAKGMKFPENSRILISKTMFQHDSEVFLDDFTLDMLRNEIKVDIIAVENDGRALINALLSDN